MTADGVIGSSINPEDHLEFGGLEGAKSIIDRYLTKQRDRKEYNRIKKEIKKESKKSDTKNIHNDTDKNTNHRKK